MEVDLEAGELEWGENIRIWVNLNIRKPLVRLNKLSIKGLEPMWLIFTYEKLLDFCFRCGIIDHGLKECSHRSKYTEAKMERTHSYGLRLKASLRGVKEPENKQDIWWSNLLVYPNGQ